MLLSAFAAWKRRLLGRAAARPLRAKRRRHRNPAKAAGVQLLEDRTLLSAIGSENILVVSDTATASFLIREYTRSGDFVQSFTTPYPGGRPGGEAARDLVVDDGGRVHVYNGTNAPYLSTLDPVAGTWSHTAFAGWSTEGTPGFGGIGAIGDDVFASDTWTAGDSVGGIVRFDAATGDAARFGDLEFRDLTVGLDGLIYTLDKADPRVVRGWNPATMAEVKRVTLSFTDVNGIAVDAGGNIFAAEWNGLVVKIDPTGTVALDRLLVAANLTDIDVAADGTVILGSYDGDLHVTDAALSAPRRISLAGTTAYVAFGSSQLGPGAITGIVYSDADRDGTRDAGEEGIAGVTVYVDVDRDEIADAGEPTATTAADGSYVIADVPPGRHFVRQVTPNDYQPTWPGGKVDSYYGIDAATREFVTIDALTGSITRIGPHGANTNLTGLIRTKAGEVFAIAAAAQTFWRLDPSTGAAAQVGNTGRAIWSGLSYDPVADRIYGIGTLDVGGIGLVTFDRTTGLATPVGTAAAPFQGVSSAAWDPVSGRVIVFDNTTDNFYALDPATGVASFLSTAAQPIDAYGLAFDGTDFLIQHVTGPGTTVYRVDLETGALTPALTLSEGVALDAFEAASNPTLAHVVSVAAGQTTAGIDFGNASTAPGSITGTVYSDRDGDGTRDADEPGTEGITVYLDFDRDGALDAGESTTVTGPDGFYRFDGVATGEYLVREVLPSGFTQSQPGAEPDVFYAIDVEYRRLMKIDSATGAVTPIALQPPPGTATPALHGLAYTNGGELYALEANLYPSDALWKIDPLTGGLTRIGSTGQNHAWGMTYDPVTDTIFGVAYIGGYVRLGTIDRSTGIFAAIPGGNGVPSNGDVGALTGTGGIAFDTDRRRIIAYDFHDGEIYSFSLDGTATKLSQTAANLSGGLAYDGERFIMERRADDALIALDPDTGVTTVIGRVSVQFFEEALEFVPGHDFSHTVTVAAGATAAGFDFGNESTASGSITGTIYADRDGDGRRGAGEPGTAGVTVYVDLDRDGIFDPGEPTAMTAADGFYTITDVAPGPHVVREVVPAGFVQTDPGPHAGTYYAVERGSRMLMRIDAASGAVTPIGPTGAADIHGLIVTNDGKLFGIQGDGTPDDFWSIDPQTGAAIRVGSTGAEVAWGLAYDAATDTIYGIAQVGNYQLLGTYDRVSGAFTPIPGGNGTHLLTGTTGVAFDPVLRRVIAYEWDGEIWQFTLDGTATLIATTTPNLGLSLTHDGRRFVMKREFNSRTLIQLDVDTGAWSLCDDVGTLSLAFTAETLEFVPGDDFSRRIIVAAGATTTGVDFGNEPPAGGISGIVWDDLDFDGVRDAGEPGRGGVTVYLDLNNNGLLDDTPPEVVTADPDAFAAGTVLTDAVPGITFTSIANTGQTFDAVKALAFTPGGHLFGHRESYGTEAVFWGGSFPKLRADFDRPVDSVAVDMMAYHGYADASQNAYGRILAFDAAGNQIAAALSGPLSATETTRVTVSAPGIAYVLAYGIPSTVDTSPYVLIDKLTATTVTAEPSSVTAADGSYSFTGLAAGTYFVREVTPRGWARTSYGNEQNVYYGTAYVPNGGGAMKLVTIDAVTGQITWIGDPLPTRLYGLIRTNTGELYGTNYTNDSLYRVDPATGRMTLVGSTGWQITGGLAYNPLSDTIYSVGLESSANGTFARMLVLDRDTGRATALGPGIQAFPGSTNGPTGVSSLAYDVLTNRLIAFDNGDGEIYAFDWAGNGMLLSAGPNVRTWAFSSGPSYRFFLQPHGTGDGFLTTVDLATSQLGPSTLTLSEAVRLESLDWNYDGFRYAVQVDGGTATGIDIGVYDADWTPSANANGPYQINEGGLVVLSGAGSSDIDDDPLTYEWDIKADGTIDAAGVSPVLTWQQLLAAGVTGDGVYTVRLRVRDPRGNSSIDNATLTVANVAPIGAEDAYQTNYGAALTVASASGVLANDSDAGGDPLSAILVTGPTHGTLTLNPDGSFTYTPEVGFSGDDSFVYRASDGAAQSGAVTVTITVGSPTDVFVDLLTDEDDGNYSAGDLSLREAVKIAPTGGTILFASALSGGTILLTGGQITLDRDVTIAGLGATSLAVSGNNASLIFTVAAGASVRISGLTLTGGNSFLGGAVINNGALAISDAVISGNTGHYGGAISNHGTLAITGSVISDNDGGNGGAIYVAAGGVLSLRDSVVTNNIATGNGGAIEGVAGSTLVIANTEFSLNATRTSGGGAIYAGGDLALAYSTLSRNSASRYGGGLYVAGTARLDHVALDNNSAATNGGAIYNAGTLAAANVTVSNSSSMIGGGVANYGSFMASNFTLSGNKSSRGGGGLFNQLGTAVLQNATVFGNRTETTVASSAIGGGLYIVSGNVTLFNTIVVGNTVGAAVLTKSDIQGPVSADSRNNLVGDTATRGGLTNGSNGNIVGVDPATVLDATLRDNGGSTFTHALLAGSAAIDAGSNSDALDPYGDPLTNDQRGVGFARVSGAAVDIGAFESQVPPAPEPDLTRVVVDLLTDENDGDHSVGDLSLREAVGIVADGGMITFASSLWGGTIALTLGQIDLARNVSIVGPGVAILAISGNDATRIFSVAAGANVAISDLTLTAGRTTTAGDHGGAIRNEGTLSLDDIVLSRSAAAGIASFGGGIYNIGSLTITNGTVSQNSAEAGGGIFNNGTLVIAGSVFSGNASDNGGAIDNGQLGTLTLTRSTLSGNTSGFGGGLINWGTATIIDSTISDNTASTDGGGISAGGGRLDITRSTVSGNTSLRHGGGIAITDGTFVASNVTVSGNSAVRSGGGVYTSAALDAVTTLRNVTIFGNRADSGDEGVGTGGGLMTNGSDITLYNTIVAGNAFGFGEAGEGFANDIFGPVTAESRNNLVGHAFSAGGMTDGTNGNIVGVNPATVLNPVLRDNGGPTFTHVLLAGGAAIDNGSNAHALDPQGNPLTTDQRGTGYLRTAGAAVDIGAYEAVLTVVVDTLTDEKDGDHSAGDLSLREAVALLDAGGTLTFASSLAGGTIILTGGRITLDQDIIIVGLGAAQLAISGNDSSGIFYIVPEATVELSGLTLTKGWNDNPVSGATGLGGAIDNRGTLTVTDSIFDANAADNFGGAISNFGVLTVSRSTFTNNSASWGGAIHNRGGTLTVSDSHFSDNDAGWGGAIDNDSSSAGEGLATVTDSTISGNFANWGGGISNGSIMTLVGVTVSGNYASEAAGGIDSSGTITLVNVTVSSNSTGGDGGGIEIGNTATLRNVTVFGNRAGLKGSTSYSGGGIRKEGGTLTLHNTLIAGNLLGTGAGTANDVRGWGNAATGSHNFIADAASTTVPTNGVDGNIVGADWTTVIDPVLRDNGGPTLTHALLRGGTAVNAGSDAQAIDAQGNPLAFDQRGAGFPRRSGRSVDIGAFELPNASPVATPDSYAVNEDTTLRTPEVPGLLDNDSDADGDPLTAVLVSGPAHGTLTLNADGTFVYTPDANYAGADSFTYKVSDGSAESAVATVTITVNAVNDVPTVAAPPADVTVNEDAQPTTIALDGVFADADGDPITLSVSGNTNPGLVSASIIGGELVLTYTGNGNGTATLTLRGTDPAAAFAETSLLVTVTAVNDAPTGADDSYAVAEDGVLTVAPAAGVLANDADIDGDGLTATLVSGPAHGTLTLNADGSFTYTPAANYHGGDAFTYRASDGTDSSAIVTVSIEVTAVNDAPVAAGDEYETDEDMPLTVPATSGVLANDSDIDGDALSAVLVTGPSHGTLSLNADGSFTYTPEAGFNGDDAFSYRASDGGLDSAPVVVTLHVVPPEPSEPLRYDFGTSSSPLAAGYARVTAETAYSAAFGHGWTVGAVDSRDRGTADPLTRDFVFGSDATFAVDLANGTYQVTVTLGDAGYAHEQMGLFLEGAQVDSVSTTKGQFATRAYTVDIADGQLTLRLRDLGGDSPFVVLNAIEIAARDIEPPSAVTGLTASAVSPSRIDLSWAAVAGATGYEVERSTDGGATWVPAGTAASAGYSDTGLQAETTYSYRVRAVNAAGAGPYSAVASAVTPAEPPAPSVPRRYDFGTSSSPIASDYARVTEGTAYSAAQGYGWLGGAVDSRDRGTADPLTRDFNLTSDAIFAVDLANGTYAVTVTLGDAAYTHDEMGLYLEGALAGSVSTAKGQFAVKTFTVTVADGQLTLRLRDLGGDSPFVVLNALKIEQLFESDPSSWLM